MAQISIIIPVYNAEKYIRRCLDSVLRQSFQDYRVILVNDGSIDASLALCRKYCDRDPRFIVLDKKNGGAASARNLGLDWDAANDPGQWLCFLDIDDYIHERYLQLLLSAALENHAKISMCSYVSTTKDCLDPLETDAKAVCIATETVWCERQIYCTVPVVKLFARDLWRGIRFPEGIIHEDEFTLYRVLFQCETIAFLDLPLYGYYQTETSVMRGAWTPRHMTEPDGLQAQLEFFQQNGYARAAAYTAKIYLLSLDNNYQRCDAAGKQYAEYAGKLKKRLAVELRRYRKLSGITLRREPWVFTDAYPIRTLPYKAWRRLRGK